MVSNSLSLLLPISFPSIFKPDSPSSSSSSSSSIPTKFPFFSDSSRFPKSFRLFRCQIPASSSSASNQLRDDASPDPFFQNNSIADFMRFKRDGPSAELQTAIVSYKKKFPWSILQPFVQVSPPSSNSSNRCSYFLHGVSTLFQVDLVSTIHIADKEYFKALQKELESYDSILYEMVASKESLENRKNPAAMKKLKSSRSRGLNILGCIQRQMARVLTLDFQLDCLDYQASNWYHADLDYETFRILQTEKGENFFTFARDMTIRSTKAMVQPTTVPEDLEPWKSKLLWASRVLPMPLVGLLIIGSVCADGGSQASEFPEFEALSRLDLGAAMKVFLAKRLTSEFTQVTAEVEESSVIIGERNKAATEALRDALDKGHNRIAILYGGGHMPDLGRRLREEFDLIPCRVKWITAWSITKRKLGSSSLPFLKALADVSGWPLNRYQTLALLIFSSVLAVDLWFWELFFGTAANWISEVALEVYQYIDNVQLM